MTRKYVTKQLNMPQKEGIFRCNKNIGTNKKYAGYWYKQEICRCFKKKYAGNPPIRQVESEEEESEKEEDGDEDGDD
jgi:hypothetical protein